MAHNAFLSQRKPSLREAFGSVMLGISLGSFTPGEIGDFAGSALHITDAKRSHLVGLALLDKAQIFIVSCSAGIFSLACLTSNNTLFILRSSYNLYSPLQYFCHALRNGCCTRSST